MSCHGEHEIYLIVLAWYFSFKSFFYSSQMLSCSCDTVRACSSELCCCSFGFGVLMSESSGQTCAATSRRLPASKAGLGFSLASISQRKATIPHQEPQESERSWDPPGAADTLTFDRSHSQGGWRQERAFGEKKVRKFQKQLCCPSNSEGGGAVNDSGAVAGRTARSLVSVLPLLVATYKMRETRPVWYLCSQCTGGAWYIFTHSLSLYFESSSLVCPAPFLLALHSTINKSGK